MVGTQLTLTTPRGVVETALGPAWLEGPRRSGRSAVGTKEAPMATVLWILAVVLVIAGVVTLSGVSSCSGSS